MASYRVKCQEITGVNGVQFFKNQVVDGVKFVSGSIDNLVQTGYISLEQEIAKVEEIKPNKKDNK